MGSPGAYDLLASWAAFESDLRGVDEEPEGILRVVVPHAFGQERLVKPLGDYLKRYPRMTVEWLLHDDSAIQNFIAAGIDCAIQVGEVADSALVAIKLGEVPRIVVAAPSLLDGLAVPEEAMDLAGSLGLLCEPTIAMKYSCKMCSRARCNAFPFHPG